LIVHQESIGSFDDVKQFKKEELDEFFSKPSIIVCLSDKEMGYQADGLIPAIIAMTRGGEIPSTTVTITSYEWLPEINGLTIVNKKGKGVNPASSAGRFSNLFNSHNWEWKCSFSKLPSKYAPIANNLSNIPVALRADIGEGRVFIIPTPDINIYDYTKYPTFLRQLIDICEEEIEDLGRKEVTEPDWVEQHVDPLESRFLNDWFPYYERYNALRGARKLFYVTSLELTRIVHFVINMVGFKAEIREEEGIQDIEICEDDFNYVVEVASSKEHWINIDKTRQLADWCRKFEQKQNKKSKGILIANSYCDLSPADRDEPFTPKAIEQGEAEGFCMMTTIQLYNIFCKFLKGEIDKDILKKLFMETKGLLKLEE